MSELKEYIITLHNKEDLDSFYEDMETPGGSLYIPDRAVELTARRVISRNTHYMLTQDEVDTIIQDPRVWDIISLELASIPLVPVGYTTGDQNFSKTETNDATHKNWGLLRQSESENRANWGTGGITDVVDNLTITASGKNVDIVVFDGHIDPNHPEFAVNPDGSGGSRVVQYNWFQNDIGFGTGNYIYTPYIDPSSSLGTRNNNHGCHVAGTIAGNTQGWARDATIYNINIYSTNPNWGSTGFDSTTYWDYVRAWHNSKPINAETGRKNPTLTNHSYGSSIFTNYASSAYVTGPITRVEYRGVDFNPGRALTLDELHERGFNGNSLTAAVPFYFTSRFADIQDAINDGIIVVAAAGNDNWRIVNSTDPDYDNSFLMTFNGTELPWYMNRGTGSAAGFAPIIVVGAASVVNDERRADFSNAGSQVDVYAAGEGIQSSVHSGGLNDIRNTTYEVEKKQGTSMASPQVCGILALLAETWYNMNQEQAHTWIINNSNKDQLYDSLDSATSTLSLRGGDNNYARWINQRPIDGNTYPNKNFAIRPSTGSLYPRPKLRRKG